MIAHIAINLLQVLFILLLAPLAKGVSNRLKERLQSRRGPPVLQTTGSRKRPARTAQFRSWKLSVAPQV